MKRCNLQPELSCETVAIACRACSRIGKTAGTDDDAVKGICACVCLHACDADTAVVLRCDKLGYGFVADGDAGITASAFQRRNDIMRIVGDGKDTAAAFGLDGNTEIFKHVFGFLRRKTVDCAEEETRIGRDRFDEVIGGAVIGDVAPSLSRDS